MTDIVTSHNSNFSERLKATINHLGLSTNMFAQKIGVNTGRVTHYYNGKTPGIDFLQDIGKVYPQINLSWLLTGEGHMLKSQSTLEEQQHVKKEIIVATEDTSGNITIPVINYKAAANYLNGYQSQEYFEELPALTLPPGLIKKGQHYALQVVGDSMYSTLKDGSIVVCRLLEKSEWERIKSKEVYVVVTKSRGINIKRVINRLREYGFLRCKSDNRKHSPYNVFEEDIIQVWEASIFLGHDFSNLNEDIYDKVSFLEEEIDDFRAVLKQMKAPLPAHRKYRSNNDDEDDETLETIKL